MGNRYRGTLGKDIIASSWRGKDYIKAYAKPIDPKTERQLEHRAIIAEAVKTWQGLKDSQKEFYEKMSDGLPGYQFFVSLYIRTIKKGKEFRTPIRIRWSRRDCLTNDGVFFIVQRPNKQLFVENLYRREGEIALGPDDTPYTFLMMDGSRIETLLELNEIHDYSVPETLRSLLFGIELALRCDENHERKTDV